MLLTGVSYVASALAISILWTVGSRVTVGERVRRYSGSLFAGSLLGSLLLGSLTALFTDGIIMALAFASGAIVGGTGLVMLRKPNAIPLFDGAPTAKPHELPPQRDNAALIAVSFYLWILLSVGVVAFFGQIT